MSRPCIAWAALIVALCAVPLAHAKGGYWVQICGASGCKVVKDELVAAAVGSEAESRGSTVRFPSRGPVYSIRWVTASSGEPTGRTYWLTRQTVDFLIQSSQRSVSDLFVGATADVDPFPGEASSSSASWVWFVGCGGAIAAVIVAAVLRSRRVRLAVGDVLRL